MNPEATVMIVDDESGVRDIVSEALAAEGYDVVTAASAAEALGQMADCAPDLMLVDLNMPGMNGHELIVHTRRTNPKLPAVMLTGHASVDNIAEAFKSGASDFMEKPFRVNRLTDMVRRNLKQTEARAKTEEPADAHIERFGSCDIVGQCAGMREAYRTIRRVGRCAATTVLIQGETGTGKELIARAIHHVSPRRNKPLIEVNCAALTETLLEAELFGYDKGAFTGAATTGKPGFFEIADGGAIFLDEIGEMSLKMQAKLLRVLEEKRYRRVGGVQDIQVDVRIIASTNRDLAKMVAAGAFRADLYFRLAVVPVRMPPLRERREDIPHLAQHFLDRFNTEFGKRVNGFSESAGRRLLEYAWPGNVRELRNVIERAVIMESDDVIGPKWLTPDSETGGVRTGKTIEFEMEDLSIAAMEKQLIHTVLKRTAWHRKDAAGILGINRTTLYNKIKEYELAPACVAS